MSRKAPNKNYAIEDMDGDNAYTVMTEVIYDRDGELFRGARSWAGDKDTHP